MTDPTLSPPAQKFSSLKLDGGNGSSTESSRDSEEYRASLGQCLRWDPVRQEPYLQLPSYPELRITPFRAGIEDQIVSVRLVWRQTWRSTRRSCSVLDGSRLLRPSYPDHILCIKKTPLTSGYSLQSPGHWRAAVPPSIPVSNRLSSPNRRMDRSYAEKWVAEDMHKHVTFTTALIAGVADLPEDRAAAATTPLEPHHDVIILGLPFKSLWDTKANRIVGDIGMTPDLAPSTPEGKQRTEDEVLASPLSSQLWHIGYVLEPQQHGRGIMSELVAVVLESWVRPLMRIETVCAYVETNNKASVKVAERNGFKWIKDVQTEWPEEKGGGKRYTGYYEWKRGGDGADDERVARNLNMRRAREETPLDTSEDDASPVKTRGPNGQDE